MFNQPNYSGIQEVIIPEVLTFIHVGEYSVPHSRNFTLNYGRDERAILENNFAVNSWLIADPGRISEMLPTLVTPSQQAGVPIPIVNGWNTKRLRFVLIVRTSDAMGNGFRHIVQGYTDHGDVSTSGLLDPRMLMVVNSIISLRTTTHNTPYGPQVVEHFERSFNIPNVIPDGGGASMTSALFTMRPVDIFNTEAISSYVSSSMPMTHDIPEVLSGKVTSNIENNVPTRYLGKMINSYSYAQQESHGSMNDGTSLASAAATRGRELSLMENQFLRFLHNRMSGDTGYSSNMSSFTYTDLISAIPSISNVERFVNNQHSMASNSLSSEYWSSATLETKAAYLIATATPAIATNSLIRTMSFIAYNTDLNNPGDQVVITSVTNTFIAGEMSVHVKRFEERFKAEIAPQLSNSGYSSYHAKIDLDTFKDVIIEISLNGGPVIRYALPSFCDGILSPVITANRDSRYNMVSGFQNIMNDINDAQVSNFRPIV